MPDSTPSNSQPQADNSPLPPADANPTPASAEANASQPTGEGKQSGPPPQISPNMASVPAGSESSVAISGSAPNTGSLEVRPDSRSEGGVVVVEPAAEEPQPESVASQTAGLIRQQLDIVTQRIFFDSQEMMRVGALAPDPNNIRTMVVALADAIAREDRAAFGFVFGRVNRGISPQINDQVIPINSGPQLGGIIDGVLRDTIAQGFKTDAALRDDAIALLDSMTEAAYPLLLHAPAYLEKPLAPKV